MSTCAVRATGHLRPPGTPPSPEHATPPPPPVPGAPTALPYARLFGLTTATYGAYQALSWATAQLVDLFSLELDQDPEAASTLAGLCHHLAFIMEHIKLLRVHGREHELMQALVERRAAEDADHENQYSLMQRVVETSGTWLLTTVRVAGLWAGVRALSGAACCPEAFMTQTFVLCGDWLALDVRWVPTYVTNTATIVHVLDTSANIERDGGLAPALFRGKVEFRDVHFAYPARPDIEVLKGVTCTIDPGQRVAFVGPSGCGKSTCVCLLQRLYEPTAGQILLDDIPIERYNARWLRQQLGVVPQEPTLFDLTVEENIKLGHPSATQSDVVRAAKVANALGFILALPAGLQTRLGHGSVTLSGGQKQRLSIARAVVRRPRLLLLDEFTSALDTASEADVVQALAQAMEGCTTISIAHRPGAMMAMDQAFVFSDGRIIEWGPVDRLLEQGGAFAKLLTPRESLHSSVTSSRQPSFNSLASAKIQAPTSLSDLSLGQRVTEQLEPISGPEPIPRACTLSFRRHFPGPDTSPGPTASDDNNNDDNDDDNGGDGPTCILELEQLLPPALEREPATPSIGAEQVQRLLQDWQEVVAFLGALHQHPECTLGLRGLVRRSHARYARTLAAARHALPGPAADPEAMEFSASFGLSPHAASPQASPCRAFGSLARVRAQAEVARRVSLPALRSVGARAGPHPLAQSWDGGQA